MGKKVGNKLGKIVQAKSHKPKLDKEKEYQAEDIMDVAYVENVAFFKVKWLNYPVSQCTWEPIDHVKNFKSQIKQILKNNPVIVNYKSLNELYLNKPKKQQIALKTEEYVKKKRATGRGRKSKQILQNTKSKEVRLDKNSNETQVQIKINDPADTETEKIVRVVDLQQVFHQQTNKVHIVVRILVQLINNRTKRSKEIYKWAHIEDIRQNMDTLTLLADFLLENVQYEKTVEYANDKDPDNQVFKGVNFFR